MSKGFTLMELVLTVIILYHLERVHVFRDLAVLTDLRRYERRICIRGSIGGVGKNKQRVERRRDV